MAKKVYPHVQNIKDVDIQRTIKLLWDKTYQQQELIDSLNSALEAANNSITSQNTSIGKLDTKITQALVTSGSGLTKTDTVGGTPADPGLGTGGSDTGGGGTGPTQPADATGAGPTSAKAIIQQTAVDYAYLLGPFTTDSESTTKNTELLLRMIWRLQNVGGFQAGRQQNPSGAISNDKLTIYFTKAQLNTGEIGFHAYDVMSLGFANVAAKVQFIEVYPAFYVADPGIAS